MAYLGDVEAIFNYHVDDLCDFFTETFDEHCESKDLALTYVKSLRKLELKCDATDIRTSINEDFNPGPFILVGIPLMIDDAQYSLIPSLTGWGRGNKSAITGLVSCVSDEDGIPNHAWGFRGLLELNPGKLPIELIWEETQLIGRFVPPAALKGYVHELSKLVIGTYLEFLSLGFGHAMLAQGANSLEKELTKVDKFAKEMWTYYLDQVEESLNT
jgi:hypothetical protein